MSATKPLSQEKLDEKLCEYCPSTEYGTIKINTGPWNLCEGMGCETAYTNYLESFEPELDDETEEYVKEHLKEVDKEFLFHRLVHDDGYMVKQAEETVNKYTYERTMDGHIIMYYSIEYLMTHTVKELEKAWEDINE